MTFRMESWRSQSEGWYPMDEGPAKGTWKPRATVYEAARKCLTWTGLVCIPAMRVIDLEDGSVLWADTSQYPDAGESVLPDWDSALRADVRRELREDSVKESQQLPLDPEPALFDLEGMMS